MHQAGQIVGVTRSGKDIFSYWLGEELRFPHPGNAGFSDDDHFDACAVFAYLALREKRARGEGSAEQLFYEMHLKDLRDHFASASHFEEVKANAGCRDAFDMRALGRRLARPEFKDL